MADMAVGVGPAQADAISSPLEPLNQTRCLVIIDQRHRKEREMQIAALLSSSGYFSAKFMQFCCIILQQ
ncbi:hypothetical protein ACSQ67_004195 [Phaseolus vulgaris]